MKRTLIEQLTTDHKKALQAVVGGADVYDYLTAIRLREIERVAPELLTICEAQNRPSGEKRQPYFGAITSQAGVQFIKGKGE